MKKENEISKIKIETEKVEEEIIIKEKDEEKSEDSVEIRYNTENVFLENKNNKKNIKKKSIKKTKEEKIEEQLYKTSVLKMLQAFCGCNNWRKNSKKNISIILRRLNILASFTGISLTCLGAWVATIEPSSTYGKNTTDLIVPCNTTENNPLPAIAGNLIQVFGGGILGAATSFLLLAILTPYDHYRENLKLIDPKEQKLDVYKEAAKKLRKALNKKCKCLQCSKNVPGPIVVSTAVSAGTNVLCSSLGIFFSLVWVVYFYKGLETPATYGFAFQAIAAICSAILAEMINPLIDYVTINSLENALEKYAKEIEKIETSRKQIEKNNKNFLEIKDAILNILSKETIEKKHILLLNNFIEEYPNIFTKDMINKINAEQIEGLSKDIIKYLLSNQSIFSAITQKKRLNELYICNEQYKKLLSLNKKEILQIEEILKLNNIIPKIENIADFFRVKPETIHSLHSMCMFKIKFSWLIKKVVKISEKKNFQKNKSSSFLSLNKEKPLKPSKTFSFFKNESLKHISQDFSDFSLHFSK